MLGIAYILRKRDERSLLKLVDVNNLMRKMSLIVYTVNKELSF